MALVVADRAQETTTTTGTGTYTLAGAKTGFQSFAAVGDGNTTYYACTDGTDYEVGIGTYTASGTTLARTTIIESSNSDAAVSWSAGEKDIFVTLPASKAVIADANGVVTFDNGISEESTTITSSSGTATLNMRDGTNFVHTLTENVTYTFSNPASSGKVSMFTLKVIQDSTARTITWPTSVDWAASTAPAISTGSGAVDVFVFMTNDGGTNYYGFTAGQAMG